MSAGPRLRAGPPLRSGEPWVETAPGELFFINLLLVTPALCVLFPWALKTVLHAAGLVPDELPILDTIPWVVSFAVPYVGWLALLPIWTTVKNLRMALPTPARAALICFLLIHGGVLALTLSRWAGVA